MKQAGDKRSVFLIALAITLLGAAVRINNLGSDSLWLDEVLTLFTVRDRWFVALTLRDHPPALYWFIKVCVRLFGEAEWTLRLPSALAGVAAVPLAIVWGRQAGRQSAYVGLWAGFLLALSPFHLRYSQEARHYALLLCFSLAATLFLYLAIHRSDYRWWILFALATVVNLYTHYGALMVLAAHSVVIIGWLITAWGRGTQPSIWPPLLSGGCVFMAYLPWLSNLNVALGSNLGQNAAASTGFFPLSRWLLAAYNAFSYNYPLFAAGAFLLALLGAVVLARQGRWLFLSLNLSLLIVPFGLIAALQIARWAFPKYIIYMLPAYLTLAAVGSDWVVRWLSARSRLRYDYAAAIFVGLFAFIAAPLVQAEYDYVERDWRGAATHLGEVAQDGDLFVAINMDLSDGFNQGRLVAPFYLDRTFAHYIILDGNRLDPYNLSLLPDSVKVWFLALDRHPPFPVDNERMNVALYPQFLFVIDQKDAPSAPLEQLEAILQYLMPITTGPSPRCLLQQSLAAIYFTQNDYELAADTLKEAQSACPVPPSYPHIWHELEDDIQYALLDQYAQAGEWNKGRQIALELLARWPGDTAALQFLNHAGE